MAILREADEIVRRRWNRVGKGWKAFIAFMIVLASFIGLCALCVWLLGKVVKSLTAGGFRNSDLYLPKMRRHRF